MKAILIIAGICLYLLLCFCGWAIIYVGTGGHAEAQERKAQKKAAAAMAVGQPDFLNQIKTRRKHK